MDSVDSQDKKSFVSRLAPEAGQHDFRSALALEQIVSHSYAKLPYIIDLANEGKELAKHELVGVIVELVDETMAHALSISKRGDTLGTNGNSELAIAGCIIEHDLGRFRELACINLLDRFEQGYEQNLRA